jgi:hypothetical protein
MGFVALGVADGTGGWADEPSLGGFRPELVLSPASVSARFEWHASIGPFRCPTAIEQALGNADAIHRPRRALLEIKFKFWTGLDSCYCSVVQLAIDAFIIDYQLQYLNPCCAHRYRDKVGSPGHYCGCGASPPATTHSAASTSGHLSADFECRWVHDYPPESALKVPAFPSKETFRARLGRFGEKCQALDFPD